MVKKKKKKEKKSETGPEMSLKRLVYLNANNVSRAGALENPFGEEEEEKEEA